MKTIISLSRGKDSCYALTRAVSSGLVPVGLLTIMNENGKVNRSHAVPLKVLQKQASFMNLPILAEPSSCQDYESNFLAALKELKSNYH